MPGPGARTPAGADEEPALRKAIRQRLAETRSRTLAFVDATSAAQLRGQAQLTLDAPSWDVGHVGCLERARGAR